MWKPSESKSDPHLSLIIQGCLEFQNEITSRHPHVPFPQNACCFNFKNEEQRIYELSLPVGLLFTLWSEQKSWHGACSYCDEEAVYGIGCGGMLSTGGVIGQCIACHSSNFFHLGGLSAVGRQLTEMIEHTPYRIQKGRFGGCFRGQKEPLYQILKELGCAHLPPKNWLLEQQKPEATLRNSD